MRKLNLSIVIFVFVLLLSGCGSDGVVYNFKIRKDNYIISEDNQVIIDYKTDENGKLVEIYIDRLLTIEEMIYLNTEIEFDKVILGYENDIFTEAGFLCTQYEDLMVPVNMEVGNTKFKYDYAACEYIEVDRDNDKKTGSLARSYKLDETITVSGDIIVSIVIFDETSIERFIEIQKIPSTMRSLGVYGISFNLDREEFSSEVINYYSDIAIFEQLMLKQQSKDLALDEINGMSENINLMDFDQFAELTPLVEEFEIRYALEIQALTELVGEISAIEEVTGEENVTTE